MSGQNWFSYLPIIHNCESLINKWFIIKAVGSDFAMNVILMSFHFNPQNDKHVK